MSRRVGVVSVDFQAGTTKFLAQIDQAKAKMREFGQHGVSNVQATSAALRVMEGNMTNNLRAAERFLATLPGVGTVLKAAFPVVGAVAFLGVIGEMTSRMYDFVKKTQEAPAKISGTFTSLNSSLRTTNDELALTNTRLENDIAKLEGKRENRLAEALMEARVAADKLGESLDTDLNKIRDLLTNNASNLWQQIAGRVSDKGLREELFGESGFGGFRGQVQGITTAGGPGMNAKLQTAYAQMIAQIDKELVQAKASQSAASSKNPLTALPGMGIAAAMTNYAPLIEELTGARNSLAMQAAFIPLQSQSASLQATRSRLQGDKSNAALDKPFEDKMKALQADLDGVEAKLKAIGAPESVQVMAKAFGEAQKAIEEVNKELEKNKGHLTDEQKTLLAITEYERDAGEAEAEWKTKLAASTASTDARIKSQEMLTAAIGKGYDATKAANVETRLMDEFKASYFDPDRAGDISAMRGRYGAEYDAQNQSQVAESLQKLQQQISLERDLAAVQAQGAEAVRGVELAHKLADIARTNDKDSAEKLMAAEMKLYAEERQNATADEVAKIDQKIEATERLAAATLKGAAAVRQAKLASQLADIQRGGDTSIPGLFGIGQRGLATLAQAGADRDQQTADAAAKTDKLQALQDQIQLLDEAKQKYGETLDIDIAIRDLENQKLKTISDQALAIGGMQNGLKAFLFEAEADLDTISQKTAQALNDGMNSLVDGVSDQLANMATGQYKKGGFGKMLQGQGESMLKSGFSNLIHAGIGGIAKHFGVKPVHKPIGVPNDPIYVSVVNQPGSGSQADMDNLPWTTGQKGMPSNGHAAAAWLGKLGSILGSMLGGGGASASSSITYGPGNASGGDLDPGTIYPVGEHGMEYFRPKVPGTIIPYGGTAGGKGGDTHISIDARNAEVGVEARIMQVMHDSAVTNAMKAQAERARRTPRKTR